MARLEDLGVPAGLGDVGVAGQGVVARPLRDDEVQRLGDLGLLVERHRALTAQRLEGPLPLVPGPGPELGVGEIDLVGGEDGTGLHELPRLATLRTLRQCATRCVPPAGAAWCSPRTRTGRPARSRSPGPSAAARRPGARCGRSTSPSATPARTPRCSPARPGSGAPSTASTSTAWPSGTSVSARRTTPPRRSRRSSAWTSSASGSNTPAARRRPSRRWPACCEACGQGGIADAVHQEAYDSSFLIADPSRAFVLETAGAEYAAAPFAAGAAISNRITLGTEWTRASGALAPGEDFDRFRDPAEDTASADVRLAASRRFLAATPSGGLTPAATAAHLPRPRDGPLGRSRHRRTGAPPAGTPRRGPARRQHLHARPQRHARPP